MSWVPLTYVSLQTSLQQVKGVDLISLNLVISFEIGVSVVYVFYKDYAVTRQLFQVLKANNNQNEYTIL